MIKHFSAFRDKYLAAVLSIAVLLLSVCSQAQRKYQQYPAPGQAKWWMVDSTSHIPYGSIPSLRGGDLRPGALFYVTAPSGDTSVYSWTGERWKKEGGGAGNSFDTTYQLIFSGISFDHFLVYAYTDTSTGYHYYNDSIAIKGQNGIANGKFWGRFDDSTGFFYPTLQRIMDAHGSYNKRNRIDANGFMTHIDSGGLTISQKHYSSGGNDTIFSSGAGTGTNPALLVTQSAGVRVNSSLNVATPNGIIGFTLNPSTGLTLQTGKFLRFQTGAYIESYQQALISTRSYPSFGGPGNGGIGAIDRNDTTNAGVTLDSVAYVIRELKFMSTQTGVESRKFGFHGDGQFYRKYLGLMSSPGSGDTLLIRGHDGKDKGITISALSGLIGGGGGSVDSTVYTTLLRDMQRLDSITKYRNIPASFTSSSSITVDYISRARFIGTLSHNAAFAVSNMHAGEIVFYVITGSGGPYTATFPGGFQPVLKPNTGDTTMVIGSYNGSAWYWSTNYANSPAIISVSSSSTLSSPASLGTTVLTNCSGGAVTHTLPSASSNTGLIYRLKKTDSSANAMSVTTTEGTQSITTQYAGLVIQSTGSAWVIIGMF